MTTARTTRTPRTREKPAPAHAGDQQSQDSKALTVRVPTDLWKSVKIKCVNEDTNIQAVLADYLRDWVEPGQ